MRLQGVCRRIFFRREGRQRARRGCYSNREEEASHAGEQLIAQASPVCLITGGASGIGAACVEAFATAGYCVAFGDLQTAKGETLAQKVRILYGGSMKPANAPELLAQKDIDGGLIGGASLEARSFVELVTAAAAELTVEVENALKIEVSIFAVDGVGAESLHSKLPGGETT